MEVNVKERRRRPPILKTQATPFLLIGGFAVAILAGALLLSLPISAERGEWTSFLTALFTSTSAVCVTGLVVVDTGTYWSGFGEVVILLLMQIGGLGFMTSTILLFVLLGWKVGLRERLFLRESSGVEVGGGQMTGIAALVRRIAIFTVSVELIGFLILMSKFALDEPLGQAAWWGLFHSVSAFNNAGFDLFGDFSSLQERGDGVILMTISVLFVIGGLGYLVVEDLRQRRIGGYSVDTRLILWTSAVLVLLGVLAVLVFEWGATLEGRTGFSKLLHSWFHSTTRTAGFSSLDVSEMTDGTILVTMALMFIGGASGSTAGGIKVGTFSLLLVVIISAVMGRDRAQVFGREVRRTDIDRALTIALVAVALLFLTVLALTITEDAPFLYVLFEATSAFATNGLSTGLTPELSDLGRLIAVGAMFAGRLGPLTVVVALVQRRRLKQSRLAEERVRIG